MEVIDAGEFFVAVFDFDVGSADFIGFFRENPADFSFFHRAVDEYGLAFLHVYAEP